MPSSKNQETNNLNKIQNSPHNQEKEMEAFQYSYDKVLEIWKVQNENYFKRVQIIMAVLQAGLFIVLINLLHPVPASWIELFLPISVATLGIITANLWLNLNKKQNQYLEFSRRYLRNLELKCLNVPMDYFNMESMIFSPITLRPKINTASIVDDKIVKFNWSGEEYPERDENKDNVHSSKEVRGGMISIETNLVLSCKN